MGGGDPLGGGAVDELGHGLGDPDRVPLGDEITLVVVLVGSTGRVLVLVVAMRLGDGRRGQGGDDEGCCR